MRSVCIGASFTYGRYNFSLGKVSLSNGAASFDVSLKN